jgi:hypothetical protein
MLAMRLVKLIEAHSGELCRDLTEQIAESERTSDFRRIPPEELRLAASEVYRNLGEWLLQKTESDIEARFRSVAARREAEGIRLPQFVWALLLSRDRLWHFLRRESFADNVVAVLWRTRTAAVAEPVLRPRNLFRSFRIRRSRPL